MELKKICFSSYCLKTALLSTLLDCCRRRSRIPIQKAKLEIITRKHQRKGQRRNKFCNSSKQMMSAQCSTKGRKLRSQTVVLLTKSKSFKTFWLTCSHHSIPSSKESSSTELTPRSINSALKRKKRPSMIRFCKAAARI